MSFEPGSKTTRRARRVRLVKAMVHSGLLVTLMVFVYYRAPLNRAFDILTGLQLAVALLALGVALAWQVRAVLRSDTPWLRAVQILAVGLPGLLLLFATGYLLMQNSEPASFNEPLSRTDALYFTVTVFSTVGFGDIVPRTELARLLTMSQILVGVVVVGVVAKVVLGAARVAVEGRDAGRGTTAPAQGTSSPEPPPSPTVGRADRSMGEPDRREIE
jgi:hypothetical protein